MIIQKMYFGKTFCLFPFSIADSVVELSVTQVETPASETN